MNIFVRYDDFLNKSYMIYLCIDNNANYESKMSVTGRYYRGFNAVQFHTIPCKFNIWLI